MDEKSADYAILFETRMHCRMRTVRSSSRLLGGSLCSEGVSAPGGVVSALGGGVCSEGGSVPGGVCSQG